MKVDMEQIEDDDIRTKNLRSGKELSIINPGSIWTLDNLAYFQPHMCGIAHTGPIGPRNSKAT